MSEKEEIIYNYLRQCENETACISEIPPLLGETEINKNIDEILEKMCIRGLIEIQKGYGKSPGFIKIKRK